MSEPRPTKTLLIEDIELVLDARALSALPGVHVHTTVGILEQDHLIKLSIANAARTATMHFLALTRVINTSGVLEHPQTRILDISCTSRTTPGPCAAFY